MRCRDADTFCRRVKFMTGALVLARAVPTIAFATYLCCSLVLAFAPWSFSTLGLAMVVASGHAFMQYLVQDIASSILNALTLGPCLGLALCGVHAVLRSL
jgi:hypothetical protein